MPTGLFLFDIDGTLLRAGTKVHSDSFAYAYREVYGVEATLDGVEAAGRTDTWLLAQPLRQLGMTEGEIAVRMREAFDAMERYVDQHLGDLRKNVLPGVPEVLARLDEGGQVLGLLTGNLRGIALAKMRKAGLAHYFDTGAFGEESADRAHLVPVALSKVAEATGRPIAAGQAVVIGDTPLDVAAGRQGGTRTVGVATGPYDCAQLEASGADVTLEDLAVPDAVPKLLALVR